MQLAPLAGCALPSSFLETRRLILRGGRARRRGTCKALWKGLGFRAHLFVSMVITSGKALECPAGWNFI